MVLTCIVLMMVVWLFCLTCVMDSKVSKIAADIAEIKNTSTNSQSMPLSKDKPVPREGLTLNEGLWPNKQQ